MIADFLRKQAVEYIQRWIGTPYKWGGDDFSGFDCSGLIIETLQSVGLIKPGEDLTAHGLYLKFKNGKEVSKPYWGCLVFWFKSGKATHVAMLINKFQLIDSSGGGKAIQSAKDAIKYNAFIKIRPLNYRGYPFKIIDPFKDWEPEEEK